MLSYTALEAIRWAMDTEILTVTKSIAAWLYSLALFISLKNLGRGDYEVSAEVWRSGQDGADGKDHTIGDAKAAAKSP